jgi:hypothetical protein
LKLSHGKATVGPTAAFPREGSFAMRDPLPRSFAEQVHHVVDLDTRRASTRTVDADLASNAADLEVKTALRVLAASLRGTHQRDEVDRSGVRPRPLGGRTDTRDADGLDSGFDDPRDRKPPPRAEGSLEASVGTP